MTEAFTSLRDDYVAKVFDIESRLKGLESVDHPLKLKQLRNFLLKNINEVEQRVASMPAKRIKKIKRSFNSKERSLNDSMLAKKPASGWKCATCDKDITNMESKPAQY